MHDACSNRLQPHHAHTASNGNACPRARAGGVSSPYFPLLQAANVHGMQLREGSGNVYVRGAPSEPDEVNVVWIVDSNKLPFFRAEAYHQFHNGLGKAFSPEYTRDLKAQVRQSVGAWEREARVACASSVCVTARCVGGRCVRERKA